MYPMGHFAVSYFLVEFFNRFLKEDYKLSVLFFASILPDVDLFFYSHITHRGPTHSIIIITLIFIPIYIYNRSGVSYFIALLSHPLIGDIFQGSGTQLLWPLSKQWYGVPYQYRLLGRELILLELLLLVLMIIHIKISSNFF